MPTNIKMGFEGQILFSATPGATATTLLENVKDANYNLEVEKGNTTVRGDGTEPPIETEDVTIRKVTIDFTMIKDTTDTALEALLTALYAGTGVAIRMKDYSAGKGFDGDCTGTVGRGKPLNGEQTLQINLTPSRSYGRAPQLYV
jgi:hypothetical protein